MNLLLPLILAHFLADYPMQSNRLVAYKSKHFAGIVLHSLTHVLTSFLLTLPFIASGKLWLGIAAIFVTHNLFDEIKVNLNRRFPTHFFLFYVIDQIAHWLVIVAVSCYSGLVSTTFAGPWLNFYTDQTLMRFLLILILVTYFYDVSRWTYRNAKKPRPYVRDWGMMGRNALLVAVAYGVYWGMVY